ncbi:hypothetical protein ACN4EG_22960 [Alkalinema pantanalense CENA528]|uniref:hypothetical protein n=1 Tax=Alkalinema pantanalense TaxID=1620705 RepID=UPI003D6DE595
MQQCPRVENFVARSWGIKQMGLDRRSLTGIVHPFSYATSGKLSCSFLGSSRCRSAWTSESVDLVKWRTFDKGEGTSIVGDTGRDRGETGAKGVCRSICNSDRGIISAQQVRQNQ